MNKVRYEISRADVYAAKVEVVDQGWRAIASVKLANGTCLSAVGDDITDAITEVLKQANWDLDAIVKIVRKFERQRIRKVLMNELSD
ncbi:MAG: hypothetical protein DRJ03_28495 [Chloroflexi bacterium]|nr:MAG: hypothetical protein DRJ03_28495 [Chloroflexota bacterium]